MGQKGKLVESRGRPEYVDFIQAIFSFLQKELWFPSEVSFCRCQFDIKRTNLLDVLQLLNHTHMQPKFTQRGRTPFTLRDQKAICQSKIDA